LTFGDESDGAMGLSAPVGAALDQAVAAVEELIGELSAEPAVAIEPRNKEAVSS
jgi:hypothetical protein